MINPVHYISTHWPRSILFLKGHPGGSVAAFASSSRHFALLCITIFPNILHSVARGLMFFPRPSRPLRLYLSLPTVVSPAEAFARNIAIILVSCVIYSVWVLQSLRISTINVAAVTDVPVLAMISDRGETVSAYASSDSVWRTVVRFSKALV